MKKRAEEAALKAYPQKGDNLISQEGYRLMRSIYADGYEAGYEQAEKDIIALIESRISEILGDAQPKPALRAELQELIKRIKEEEYERT